MSSVKPLVFVHAFSKTDPALGILPEWEAQLRQHFDLVVSEELKQDPSKAERVEGALSVVTRIKVLDEHLPTFTNLKVVANYGVGTNHLDLSRFARLGIKVSNTPDVLNHAVAEMTLALMLALARGIISGVKNNALGLSSVPAPEIRNSTVGIVGMGSIGLTTARLLRAVGANIVYHNRNQRSAEDEDALKATYYSDLEEMLSVSDFVIVLCPLTPSTRHLIGECQFAAMKPTAILINVGRGQVVDTDALVKALRNDQIYAAGLDVTDPEPLPPDHPLVSDLHDRVIITPHCATNTGPCKDAIFKLCLENLIAGLIDKTSLPNEVIIS